MNTKNSILILLLFVNTSFIKAQQDEKVETTKKLISLFHAKEFEKITPLFDKTMKAALPKEKLETVWMQLTNQMGDYVRYSTITTEKVQGYDIVYLLCEFKKGKLRMKTVFNQENQISGLFFIPEVDASSAPPYKTAS